MSDTELSVDSGSEPTTPEPVPADPTPFEPLAVEPEPEPEPQPVDATGQLIPTPEFVPGLGTHEVDSDPGDVAEEAVNPGLALAAPAYVPPAADFEHTAFNPENVQHIS
jgi:hypothetical protein